MFEPAEEERDEHVSFSQIDTFVRCPKRYEYKYIQRATPESRSFHLVFGVSIHDALAYHYKSRMVGDPVPGDALLDRFRDAFRELSDEPGPPIPYESVKVSQDGAIDLGVEMLQKFTESARVPESVLEVERKFVCDIYDDEGVMLEPQFVGYVDAVVDFGAGPVMLEHKTSGRSYGNQQLSHSAQPTFYLEAKEAEYGDMGFLFQVLMKTKDRRFESHDVVRTAGQRAEAFDLLFNVLGAIKGGNSYRRRDWQCSSCEFRRRCNPSN